MTTELEQEFFNVFGIEPECVRGCGEYYLEQGIDAWEKFNCKDTDCDKCEHDKSIWEYPEITDRRLLELICIIADGKDGNKNLNLYTANEDEWFAVLKDQNNLAYCAAIDISFRNAILKLCIYRADIIDFKHQIQQLFKEGK